MLNSKSLSDLSAELQTVIAELLSHGRSDATARRGLRRANVIRADRDRLRAEIAAMSHALAVFVGEAK